VLEELATTFGETAHYAILAGRDIVYRAKMDPPQGAVRLTSVVGGRNPAYRTAVGRALLASRLLTRPDLEEALGPFPLDARTPRTLTTAAALLQELEETRTRGFGVDDQESDVGVNCVAFAVHLDGATVPTGAISVSAVTFRCPLEQLIERVPEIRSIIARHLGPAALG
jgi:DNA-binding IclR family transcriptional regulator